MQSSPLFERRSRFSEGEPSTGLQLKSHQGDPSTSDWDEFLHQYSPYHLLKATWHRSASWLVSSIDIIDVPFCFKDFKGTCFTTALQNTSERYMLVTYTIAN